MPLEILYGRKLAAAAAARNAASRESLAQLDDQIETSLRLITHSRVTLIAMKQRLNSK
jgi:hypothetical protein